MCRNIKTLFNFEPPATELEIRDASLQFVRKLSGFTVPSKANEAAFELAVEQVAAAARALVGSLVTHAAARPRGRGRAREDAFGGALRRHRRARARALTIADSTLGGRAQRRRRGVRAGARAVVA